MLLAETNELFPEVNIISGRGEEGSDFLSSNGCLKSKLNCDTFPSTGSPTITLVHSKTLMRGLETEENVPIFLISF